MKKLTMLPCPFCGKTPRRLSFCSSDRGPMIQCTECGADGPPVLPEGESYTYSAAGEQRLQTRALAMWNLPRAHEASSYRRGIEAAAEYVEMFDKYLDHSSRLSDCIRAKFNVIGKKPIRANTRHSVNALCAAIHYYQVTAKGDKAGFEERRRAFAKFEREMKKLHKAR